MSFRRFWAVARKEFLHVLRDARSLWLALAIPMLLLLLFGYALTLDVDNVPLIVWDQDETAASRDLLSRFNGSRYFKIVQYGRSYSDVEGAIDHGEALAALVIPTNFASQVGSGRPVSVQFIVDGSDSNTAQIAEGYADAVTLAWSQQVAVEAVRRHGIPVPEPAVDLRPRVWFNTEMESKNYIVPGLIAVIMMIIAGLLTSLTVAREWERGTMEQLISTPVKPHELILGKLVPYFVIGMFDVSLVVLMGKYLFDVPLRGSVILLFAMAAIFLIGALSVGMLVSVLAKNQLLANQLAIILTFVPSYLLSGFMFSIPNMPAPLQVISHFVPATYFIALLKGIYLKGIGLDVMTFHAGLLVAFAVAMVVIANLVFRKKLT
jgi:ABC-2 type transport system permease protein